MSAILILTSLVTLGIMRITETHSQSLLSPAERWLRVLLEHGWCYVQNTFSLAVLLRDRQNENHFLRIFNVSRQFILNTQK